MYKGQIYIKVRDVLMDRDTWINTDHIIAFFPADDDDKRLFKANAVIEVTDGRIKVKETVDEICECLASYQ